MPNYIKGFTVNGEDAKYDYNQLGNKPFGDNTLVPLVPTEEVTTTGQPGDESFWGDLSPFSNPSVGDVCVVTFEGTVYEEEAKYDYYYDFLYIGELDDNGNITFNSLLVVKSL